MDFEGLPSMLSSLTREPVSSELVVENVGKDMWWVVWREAIISNQQLVFVPAVHRNAHGLD